MLRNIKPSPAAACGSRPNGYPCCQRPKLGPVSQIAAEVFRKRKSITVARRRQDAPQSMREKSRHSQVGACPGIDARLLQCGIPRKNVGENILEPVGLSGPCSQSGSLAANLIRNRQAMLAYDMAVWKC